MLKASTSFAQSITPDPTYQKITQANSANASACAQLIARNVFDQGALNVAFRVVDAGSSYAMEVLQGGSSYTLAALKTGVNAFFFAPAASICVAMATVNAANVQVCTQVIDK